MEKQLNRIKMQISFIKKIMTKNEGALIGEYAEVTLKEGP
jgi:hypothetical protein